MVNRKCGNSSNNLHISHILAEGGITHLVLPVGEADIQNTGLIVTHLQNGIIHTGDLVFHLGGIAQQNFILVAIPLPGTGAWTGALVAAMLNMRLRKAFPAIALGVIIAGVIVSVVTYGGIMILS